MLESASSSNTDSDSQQVNPIDYIGNKDENVDKRFRHKLRSAIDFFVSKPLSQGEERLFTGITNKHIHKFKFIKRADKLMKKVNSNIYGQFFNSNRNVLLPTLSKV